MHFKNRWYLAVVFLLLLFGCFTKQTWHSDHTIFGINKIDPHADFFAFETENLAKEGEVENSERFISLNGDWKFQWVKSPKDRIKEFYKYDLDDSKWGTIPVPAN